MKLSSAAALAAFAAGILCDDEDKRELICETSDSSPYLSHVEELIENLHRDTKQHNICFKGPREGQRGNTRTKWSGDGGAVFSLCSTKDDDLKLQCTSEDSGTTPCPREDSSEYCGGYPPLWISVFLDDLKEYCKGEETVGGRIRFYGGGEIRLYSAPGR